MKIGIGTNAYFDDRNPGESAAGFLKMKEHGYDCADYQILVSIKSGLYSIDENEFEKFILREKECADKAGIEISQVHGPCPTDDSTPESRLKNLVYIKRAINGAALLECKYIIIHPVMPYGWDDEKDASFAYALNKEMFTELLEYAKKQDVTICIENMPMKKHKLSRIPAIIEFVDSFDCENFAICLDTGHCNVHNDNPAKMVELCGSRLKTLHVHDNMGVSDDHLFPYAGNIDWDAFKTSLKKVDFNGCMSLETRVRGRYPHDIKNHFLIGLGEIARTLTRD